MGHSILSIQDDGKVCSFMAERGYSRSSGARGLKREAGKIREKTRKAYNTIESKVTEQLNEEPFETFEVKLGPLANNKHEIKVFRKTEV